MTTLAELQVKVSRELRDPNNTTFTLPLITDYLNDGITELSRIAPRQYQEDIEPDGSNLYPLLAEAADPRVRLSRVEIWSVTPAVIQMMECIPAASSSLKNQTDSGWRVWAGSLELPSWYATYLADDTKNLRVWGYAPYTLLSGDSDETDLDVSGQQAVVQYANFRAYEALANDRSLFQQWQLSTHSTDVSLAAVMGAMDRFAQSWRRKTRELYEIRELSD